MCKPTLESPFEDTQIAVGSTALRVDLRINASSLDVKEYLTAGL